MWINIQNNIKRSPQRAVNYTQVVKRKKLYFFGQMISAIIFLFLKIEEAG